MKHKHEFDFGELTPEEKADGCIHAVICKTCDYRLVSTSKITWKVWRWLERKVKEMGGTPIEKQKCANPGCLFVAGHKGKCLFLDDTPTTYKNRGFV